MTAHAIVHIEFAARDPKAAGKFYADLFGWKVEDMPQMNYVTFAAGEGPGGGFPAVDDQMVKAGDVLVYISVEDIEATLTRVEKLGGKPLLPKTEIPGIGWFAFFADPTGNRVGLYTGR
jgi:hypothetical protein